MSEFTSSSSNPEIKKPTTRGIEELLPRYYEAYGENTKYEVIRSIPIDGHEVAWIKYSGTVQYDITDRGREGKEYSGHELYCACKFEEGVGWRTDSKYGVVGLGGGDNCLPRKIAIHLRQQELRREYIDQFKEDAIWGEDYALLDHVPEVIMDLIARDKKGEFMGEGSSGAHFWGGHMYMQTVAAITGKPMGDLWEDMDKMQAAKQISLEGCVIQEYRQPPEPRWEYFARKRYDIAGDEVNESETTFVIAASFPAHSKMPQQWSYDVLDSEGNALSDKLTNIPGSGFMHPLDFGVDVEDEATAAKEMDELAELVKTKWMELSQDSLTRDVVKRDSSSDADVE